MFLTLNHQKMEVYSYSKMFVLECYKLANQLPSEEKYGMTTQIRRAALSVHLNLAEGASRKSSTERKRYYEIARGSIIEIDAALDIALDLKYIFPSEIKPLGETMITCFRLLSGMISGLKNNL